MKSYIRIINGVYPGDVVYVRRCSKVIAAKVESYKWRPRSFNFNDTYVNIKRADGETEHIYMADVEFYETIEDAINNKKMGVSVYNIEAVTAMFGFCEYTSRMGITALGKMYYKWDGFKVVPTHLWSCYTELTWNNQGWHFKLREGTKHTKLYETAEECRKDNHVDVITF